MKRAGNSEIERDILFVSESDLKLDVSVLDLKQLDLQRKLQVSEQLGRGQSSR